MPLLQMQNEGNSFQVPEADLPAEGNMLVVVVDCAGTTVTSTGNVSWAQLGGSIPADGEGGGSRFVFYSYGPFSLAEDGNLYIGYYNPRGGVRKAFLQEVETGAAS